MMRVSEPNIRKNRRLNLEIWAAVQRLRWEWDFRDLSEWRWRNAQIAMRGIVWC